MVEYTLRDREAEMVEHVFQLERRREKEGGMMGNGAI